MTTNHYPEESDHLLDNEDSSMATAHHALGVHQGEEEEDKNPESCCNGRFLKVSMRANTFILFLKLTTLFFSMRT